MRQQGTVKWFNRGKGIGMISPFAGEDVRVDARGVEQATLAEGETVEFEVDDSRGYLEARSVKAVLRTVR